MKAELIYPPQSKMPFSRGRLLRILRWPFGGAALSCIVVNLAVGGHAWSVVVMMSLYAVWTLMLSPDLVEYNRTSQSIKALMYLCILLVLIDVLLSPGWAMHVVPIVCFGGLIVAAVLFFSDLRRQKQNIQPMMQFSALCLIASAIGLVIPSAAPHWALIVLCAVSGALLTACVFVLGTGIFREIHKRFHTR